MKSVFDVVLIIFITMLIFISMIFFSEEVLVSQQALHIRNKVINMVEINSGFTNEVESELTNSSENKNIDANVVVSKVGRLEYGEKLYVEVIVRHKRKLPFSNNEKIVEYSSKGVFYNVNP